MQTCAHCRKRLGLGVVSKSFWNGTWWECKRFCRVSCRNAYTAERQAAIDRRAAVAKLYRRPP
jgi:hypothetical protein